MHTKIYGTIFYTLALVVAIWLYPRHPVLCGIAIGLFALALVLRGIALILRRNSKIGKAERKHYEAE